MRLFLLVLAFSSMLLCASSNAQSTNYDMQTRSCNYAKVYNLNSGEFLLVREESNHNSQIIDKLYNGILVYICDEYGDFYNVFYGRKDGKCRGINKYGIIFNETGSCKSGWVEKKWIDVLSG